MNIPQTAVTMRQPASSTKKSPTPSEIKAYLDQYVIGQESAKRVLATAVYNHYQRIKLNKGKSEDSPELTKSNVLLIGETGCGKTFITHTLARFMDVPIYIQDCTKLTDAGYIGEDVERCLEGLLLAANGNMKKAEQGIVVLDEVDKLAKSMQDQKTHDASSKSVQQGLLKMVEGYKCELPKEGGIRHSDKSLKVMDTTNILFIATGSFAGIEHIISKRLLPTKIGFDSASQSEKVDADSLCSYASAEDFRRFGMIPELIGRFPCVTNVNKLKEDDLVRILTEPKNSIVKQYTELLAADKTDLEFTDDALLLIASTAIKTKTGARGLRGVMENVLGDIMFSSPDNRSKRTRTEIIIDKDYVNARLNHHFLAAV